MTGISPILHSYPSLPEASGIGCDYRTAGRMSVDRDGNEKSGKIYAERPSNPCLIVPV